MVVNPWLLRFMLYSQADWFNGSVATTNMVTEIVNQSTVYSNCTEGWSMSNFLSVYGIYNPPVTIETRLKWRIFMHNLHFTHLQFTAQQVYHKGWSLP